MKFRRHHGIYVPTKEILVVSEVKPTFRGFFTVERFRGDHRLGIKTGHWEFENLITDAGFNQLGANVQIQTMWQYMAVGTGSTAPAAAQTALVAEIAPSATHRSNSDGSIADVIGSGPSFAYWSWKRVRLFLEAQANGNLTEVGIFSASSAGTMWTRQLFKDGTGTPTTIVKTASDQLRVTYELRVYPPTVDVTGTKTISGSNYDYVIRASEIDTAAVWGADTFGNGMLKAFGSTTAAGTAKAFETNTLGTTQQSPSGTSVDRSSTSVSAYTTGDFFRDHTYVWEPGIANFATGIGAIQFWATTSGHAFQESFTPKLPKDNTKRLTLVQRISWARH